MTIFDRLLKVEEGSVEIGCGKVFVCQHRFSGAALSPDALDYWSIPSVHSRLDSGSASWIQQVFSNVSTLGTILACAEHPCASLQKMRG